MVHRLSSSGIRLVLMFAIMGALAFVAPAATSTPTSAAAGSPCPWEFGHPTLSHGDTGGAVGHAQCLLNIWGYVVAEDGIFGGDTEQAIKNFQWDTGLYVDGTIGKCTWAMLHPDGMVEADCYRHF